MKTVKVWIEKGNKWILLHQGEERVRVVLDEQDQESTQIESILFDPYRNPEESELEVIEESITLY